MTWTFGGEPFTTPRARTSPWKSKPSMRRKGGFCSSARPKERSRREALARFIAKRHREGRIFDLDDLLLLFYLRSHSAIDIPAAAQICQRPPETMRDILEGLVLQPEAWLERRGRKTGVTYHLSPNAASELLSKAVYTRTRDIDAIRYPELIRAYVEQHGSINNKECRELLGLGNSPAARVNASRLLSRSKFLKRIGESRAVQYRLKNKIK